MLFATQQFDFSNILMYFKCVHEQLQVYLCYKCGINYCKSVYFCSVVSQSCEHMSTNMMFASYFSQLTLPQEKDAKRGPSTVMLFQEKTLFILPENYSYL